MSLLTPRIRPSAVARANPVSKLVVSLLISVALLMSIDWVSAGVAVAIELALLPFAGVGMRSLRLRTAPLVIAAPLAGITTVLYGRDSGQVLFQWGLLSVTDGSVALGFAVALRIIAIGLPGIVLFATTDPTDLADGLAQVLRLPARFVLGGLAALRLVGLLVEDWRSIAIARRARGIGGSRNPVIRAKEAAGQGFTLLVIAIRRGSKLATAMEAKGFGADSARTWARPSVLGLRDLALVAVGVGIAVVAVGAAVLVGSWEFVLG